MVITHQPYKLVAIRLWSSHWRRAVVYNAEQWQDLLITASLQGTYLPAKIGLDLEQMQHYQSLRDMGKHVKNLYEKLHLQHDLLRSQNPAIDHRQSLDNDSMTRRLTARLDSISSWKYAPAPVKSLRNRAAG